MRVKPGNIVADASLDNTTASGKWVGDYYKVCFIRDGKVIAGIDLSELALRILAAVLNRGIEESEERCHNKS